MIILFICRSISCSLFFIFNFEGHNLTVQILNLFIFNFEGHNLTVQILNLFYKNN